MLECWVSDVGVAAGVSLKAAEIASGLLPLGCEYVPLKSQSANARGRGGRVNATFRPFQFRELRFARVDLQELLST
jgi:hypothetical protein